MTKRGSWVLKHYYLQGVVSMGDQARSAQWPWSLFPVLSHALPFLKSVIPPHQWQRTTNRGWGKAARNAALKPEMFLQEKNSKSLRVFPRESVSCSLPWLLWSPFLWDSVQRLSCSPEPVHLPHFLSLFLISISHSLAQAGLRLQWSSCLSLSAKIIGRCHCTLPTFDLFNSLIFIFNYVYVHMCSQRLEMSDTPRVGIKVLESCPM